MPITNTVQSKDVVFVQRANDNTAYGEVHISGSQLLLFIDSDGNINADVSASFYSAFPPVNGATGTFTSADAKTITVVNGIITTIV